MGIGFFEHEDVVGRVAADAVCPHGRGAQGLVGARVEERSRVVGEDEAVAGRKDLLGSSDDAGLQPADDEAELLGAVGVDADDDGVLVVADQESGECEVGVTVGPGVLVEDELAWSACDGLAVVHRIVEVRFDPAEVAP